jgi:tRNA pseudouridine13 synthase
MNHAWPFLTSTPPISGRYKCSPEDFVVDELPAYAPSGEGEHLLVQIRKRGLSTHEAVARIARSLGLAPAQIGVAGLKDAQGVTSQWISVQGVERGRLDGLGASGIEVLQAARHKNKLRVGHLRGNRFQIRLREIDEADDAALRGVFDELARRGVPNYFGEQRFGLRGDTWRIGRALLLEEWGDAAAWIAGRPGPHDSRAVRRARELFDAGDYERAAEAWPGGFRVCIRVCRALAKSGGNARRALYAADHNLLRFYTSAYQSWLFNALLARRLNEFDRVRLGDLAWLHRNGAVFLVKDLAVDAPRAEALEISASGPLFGTRMSMPQGTPLELEQEVLASEGHALEAFTRPGRLQWQGGRRPLRFPLAECAFERGADARGAFVELRFHAPPGCYATSVLRELFKRDDLALEGAPSAPQGVSEAEADDGGAEGSTRPS